MDQNIKRLYIFILSIVLLVIGYYIISITFGRKSDGYENYYFYQNWSDHAITKRDALKNGILLKKDLKIEILKDSLMNFNKMDFWLSKRVIHNKYGIFPLLHFVDTAKQFCDVNFKSHIRTELYFQLHRNIKFKEFALHKYYDFKTGETATSFFDYSKFIGKLPKDTIILEFFVKEKDGSPELINVGAVKLSW